MNSQTPTFIEVCAGCGGLSSGFIKAGFKPILVNELDATCCETLRKNHAGIRVEEGSMVKLDLKSFKGKVDILQGGVPCQAFSQAGLKRGFSETRGTMFFEIQRILAVKRPDSIFAISVMSLMILSSLEPLCSIISTKSR